MIPFHMPLAMETDDVVLSNREPAAKWSDVCRIFSMTSSPGGRIFTGGANNGNISIWDTNTGGKEGAFSGHEDCVIRLVYCEGVVYSSSADSTARSWNLTTQKEKMVFKGHRALVAAMWAQHSNNGTGLYTGSDDETVKQWNTETGVCVHTYKGHSAPINTIVCSETHMFSGSADGKIFVWDLFTRKKIRAMEMAHKEGVWCLALLPDGRLVSGGSDGMIKIWNEPVDTNEVRLELPKEHKDRDKHSGKVRDVLVQGPVLFSCGADGDIHAWNLNTGKLMEKLISHEKQVTSLTMQNNRLVSCGFDMQMVRWDIEDLLPVKQPVVPLRPLGDMAVEVEKKENEDVNKVFEENPVLKAKLLRDDPIQQVLDQYTTLPVKFLLSSLRLKVETSRLMSELFLFVPFLLSFIFFFLLTRPIEDTYYMVSAVNDIVVTPALRDMKVDRTFNNLVRPDHWNRWLSTVVVPGLFANRTVSGADPNVLRGQNYLIGALRIRTHRVHNHSCTPNTELYSAKKCHGHMTDANMQTSPYACEEGLSCVADYDMLNTVLRKPKGFNFSSDGSIYIGRKTTYPKGGYAVTIPFSLTTAEALERVQAIAANGFVDTVRTRLILVEFITYNTYINTFSFNRYAIEVTREGAWWTHVHNYVFTLFDDDVGATAYEAYFMTFVMFYVMVFFFQIFNALRRKRFLAYVLDFWNILELVNLAFFLAMYGSRVIWYQRCKAISFKIPYINDADPFPTDLELITETYTVQVWINSVNTILTFLKLLKFVRLNNRLNILTRTLAACQQSLVGVLVLFVYIVFAFALTGNALYGGNILSFRSLEVSYSSLLRQLLGDFDYDAMQIENEQITFFFFWSFEILALFIMLNFLVAVISDGFADVSTDRAQVPLDAAIVKAFHDLSFECVPSGIKRKLILLVHRRSQTLIIEKLTKLVYEQYTTEEERIEAGMDYTEKSDEYIDESMSITRAEFLDLLPKDERKIATRKFVLEVWRDVAWEYHHELIDAGNLQEHERETGIHEAVETALMPLLQAMPLFDTYLSRLEKMTARLSVGMQESGKGGATVDAIAGAGGGQGMYTEFRNPWVIEEDE